MITLSTAWYYLGFGPKTKVNYGDLIEPSLYLGELDLELDYQYLDIDSMERKWMLITFIKDKIPESNPIAISTRDKNGFDKLSKEIINFIK